MALTRDSINGKYDARVKALGARPSKYRRVPKYRTNPRNGIRRLIGYTREPNNRELQRYSSKINVINRNRNTELQRLALQQSNIPQWAKAKALRTYAKTSSKNRTSALSLAQNYVKGKEAKDAYRRRSSIKSAQSVAVKAEQNRQIALRESQVKNRVDQIRATTAQNQKVQQNVQRAGHDSTKLQRAEGRPSPRKEPVSNPEQRRFAAQQATRRVNEKVVTTSRQQAIAAQAKKRREQKIQQAQQRYANRQKVKYTPTPKPTKFPEPTKYPNAVSAGTISHTTRPILEKSPPNNSQFDEYVKNNFKKPEPKIGAPHQEYAKGFHSGLEDLYITGENTIRYVQNKPQIPQKGNPLDNLLFSPLDAGVKTVEDNSNFYENWKEKVKKVETDFWANPAYSVGASVPSALIIGASVVIPPVGAAKYGIGIINKAPKALQAITKTAKASSKIPSKIPEKVPRSLNKGKFAIGDEIDYITATRKVPKVDKNRIRTSKAQSYQVNPNLLIRKNNITSKEIPKGVDLEPRTVKDFLGKNFIDTMKNKARNTRKKNQKKNIRKSITAENYKQFKPKEPKTKGVQQTKREKSEFEKMYGRSFVKEMKRKNVAKVAENNFKISSDIMRLGNKAKTHPSGFGKVVKSGKQQLVQKTRTREQLRKDRLIQQQKTKLHNQKVREAKERHKSRQQQRQKQQTAKAVSQQTKELQGFFGKSGSKQVVKQVSKTVKKTKQGSKIKNALKTGVKVGGMLGVMAIGRKTKPKQKVRPILENPETFPQKEKPNSKQDDKSAFVFDWTYGTPIDDTTTVPITDDPIVPEDEQVFVPIYRPPTTKTTTTPKPPGYVTRRYGSGYGFRNSNRSNKKKSYRIWEIKGIFEKSRIGIHHDSLRPVDKIPKKRKKSTTPKKKIAKGKKKKAKRSNSKKTKPWWKL